jgi:hypothetical protein
VRQQHRDSFGQIHAASTANPDDQPGGEGRCLLQAVSNRFQGQFGQCLIEHLRRDTTFTKVRHDIPELKISSATCVGAYESTIADLCCDSSDDFTLPGAEHNGSRQTHYPEKSHDLSPVSFLFEVDLGFWDLGWGFILDKPVAAGPVSDAVKPSLIVPAITAASPSRERTTHLRMMLTPSIAMTPPDSGEQNRYRRESPFSALNRATPEWLELYCSGAILQKPKLHSQNYSQNCTTDKGAVLIRFLMHAFPFHAAAS